MGNQALEPFEVSANRRSLPLRRVLDATKADPTDICPVGELTAAAHQPLKSRTKPAS
jgi:hypothetical protein